MLCDVLNCLSPLCLRVLSVYILCAADLLLSWIIVLVIATLGFHLRTVKLHRLGLVVSCDMCWGACVFFVWLLFWSANFQQVIYFWAASSFLWLPYWAIYLWKHRRLYQALRYDVFQSTVPPRSRSAEHRHGERTCIGHGNIFGSLVNMNNMNGEMCLDSLCGFEVS